ncbi:DUF58 domain-containing protein [Dactylosporangium aurantiacum]|uniref:DUF58 domain-containing protein n=1 Tax=Dactylosporangium aurantiacum TaxID=35754 RepID=A0A9Q9I899_9ACTN|nr:DUF58 domain-containing protein [Dactylosporangium aurantiacum]MDG6105038.1 DUF58 domain-containing protein [Dactylosporangium aurantiacum]UWZ51569.1 DUF58 domain-containing protein [Dactylosporangium aurantiacum]
MASAPDRLLRRLEWQVIRRLDGQLQGAYRTVFRGSGIDFADLREYTPEDDVRHIDWNVTARLDEPYVRQYTEDRELTAWLVLDLSASMRFGGAGQAGRGKDGLLTELAVCLARLFTQGGNRIGAVLYDNGLQRVVPPRTGRTHVLRIAHEIDKATRAAAALRGKPGGAATDVDAMLRLAAAQARRRGLIFVISDFLSGDTVNWQDALSRLTHRHEVVAVRVVDPMELDLPDLGLVLVEDAETGEQVLVDTSDPLFQQRLREEVDGREAAVAAAMRRSRVTAHRVTTDQDPLLALVEMVRWSKRRRA